MGSRGTIPEGEALLVSLEKQGWRFRLGPDGRIWPSPPDGCTSVERARVRERFARQRDAIATILAARQARANPPRWTPADFAEANRLLAQAHTATDWSSTDARWEPFDQAADAAVARRDLAALRDVCARFCAEQSPAGDTQRDRILRILRQAGEVGVTNVELNRICFRYGARIDELRRADYAIDSIHVDGSIWRFVLRDPARREAA